MNIVCSETAVFSRIQHHTNLLEMSDSDFDDFGGFEVADSTGITESSTVVESETPTEVTDKAATSASSTGTDVSAIPWLAASIKATSLSPTGPTKPDNEKSLSHETQSRYGEE